MKFYLLFLISLFLTSCSKNNSSQVLIIGTNATYPPFEFIDKKGRIVGFDIDLAMMIGEKMNRQVVVKECAFDALVLNLISKKIDLILSGMSINSRRLEKINMVPYYGGQEQEIALVFWNNIPENASLLKQYDVVIVQVGTLQEEYALKKNLRIKSVDSLSEIILELKNKKSQIAILEPNLAVFLKSKHPEIQIFKMPLGEKEECGGFGIGIRKDDKSLEKEIFQVVQELREEGIMDSLERKWLVKD